METEGNIKFWFWMIFCFCFCSYQEEVFQCVGVPLVKNALAGYNTSILSYGQVFEDYFVVSELKYI